MAVPQVTGKQRVGRCTDQGAHSADIGGHGNAQKQRQAQVAVVMLLVALVHKSQHGQTNGQHQCRRRRVADPHAQARGGDHEAGNHPVRPDAGQCQNPRANRL